MRFWDYEVRTDSICLNRGFPRILRITRIIGCGLWGAIVKVIFSRGLSQNEEVNLIWGSRHGYICLNRGFSRIRRNEVLE